MRLGHLFSIGTIVSGLLLSATGCVCMEGSCGRRTCSTGACPTECNSCDSCNNGDFYAGRPLARLIGWDGAGCSSCGTGCNVGSGAGCGELYVDEWVNEPPMMDNCGCGECQTCGRQPIRSFLQQLIGDRYCGSCESGCDGLDVGSPIINDGYDPNAWSANRGCNCGGHSGSASSVHHHSTSVETTTESASPMPPAPVPSTASPTLAPPPPKSAARLNPATRKTIR